MVVKHLFKSIRIGNMEVPNRFVVPAMVMNYCNEDGTATERFISYHEEKAKGGWGLIITETFAVVPEGKGFVGTPGLWNDDQIPGFAEFTKRIHKYGSKVVAQIFHAGRQTSRQVIGTTPKAPSAIPCPVLQEVPEELTIDEIKDLVEKFGDAAYRAKLAGFDGVEVHGAHGYLISQFMSNYSNRRTDEYGGSLQNRLRFPLEIIANIRRKTGPNFPIIFRISGDEFVRGGRNIEDTKVIAMILEEAGIDAIHVSAGVYATGYTILPPSAVPHGWIVDFAEEVKKVVSIPVITVGRINDPLVAEAALAAGKADLVAMGRASLADPWLPSKTAAGKFDEIIPCVGCVQGCVGRIFVQQPVCCLVNPRLGREREYEIKPADEVKKVFIAGGGCAGMEAAIVARERGHDVHLFEKTHKLGGQYYLGAIPPGKGEINQFINWQKNKMNKLGVKVHLNQPLTEEIVDREKPDVIIIATGGKPIMPDIPGIDKPIVATAHDVLEEKVETGSKVIIVGGGLIGSETANYLAHHGKTVTIVEQLHDIALDEEAYVRHFLLKDLKEFNVEVHVNSKVVEITDRGVIAEKDGEKITLDGFDKVVIAVGVEPVNELAEKLKDKAPEVIVVGDAKEARKALEAVQEGYEAGLKV